MIYLKTLLSLVIIFAGSQTFANNEADAKLSKYLKLRKKMGDNLQITPVAGFNAIGYQDNTVSINGEANNYKSDAENGSTLGLLVDYNTTFYGIGLQTGLLYHRFVSAFTLISSVDKNRLEYEDSYLSLPVTIKLYPFSRAGRGFYFKGGASMNALLGSQQRVTTTDLVANSSTQSTTSLTEQKTDFDVQALLGAGVIINFTDRIGLTMEGNYHQGLVNTKMRPEQGDPQFKTEGYSALFGLNFNL